MSIVFRQRKVQTILKACGTKLQTGLLSTKPRKFKVNRIGFVTVFVTVLSCGTLILVEISRLNKKISTITNACDVDKQSEQYVSLFDTDISTEEIKRTWKAFLNPWKVSKEACVAWLESRSLDPWRLLQLTKSKDRSFRHLGVEALADIDSWDDFQYRNIAQGVDGRTLIGLARSCDVDLRFFLPPPKQPTLHTSLYDELTGLLTALPDTCVDKCVKHFTQVALKYGKPPEDQGGFWSFGGQTIASYDGNDNLSIKTVELCSLQALVRHSMIPANCVEIVDKGGLQLLQKIMDDKPDCVKTHILVARILSNLALIEALHRIIITSGWVTILAKWMKSKNLAISTISAKTLSNLDKDFTSYQLDDGVYVFYPVHRTRSVINADIVFIHGVNGGTFKTWRQNGFQINKTNNGNLSPCWPKDWLAKDINNIRIVSVDYDTHLSEWSAKCPHDIQKRSLIKRGGEMIEKLRRAGIGDRPIIWAGHSLGGLLVKQILSLSLDDTTGDYRCIEEQTKGVVFYGVPHRGSPVAKLTNQASYILYPSVEIQELHFGSPKLQYLQTRFLDFMNSRSIPCLTFGEMNKTDIGKRLPMIHIVPPDSSDPGYGDFYPMEVDHITICKPDDQESDIYTRTLKFIKTCILNSKVEQDFRRDIKFTAPKS